MKIYFIIVIYWLIATISVLNYCNIFPIYFDVILFPAYFIGFILAMTSNNIFYIFGGQLFNGAILLFFAFLLKLFIQSLKKQT